MPQAVCRVPRYAYQRVRPVCRSNLFWGPAFSVTLLPRHPRATPQSIITLSLWRRRTSASMQDCLDSLDVAVERFCAAHHPTGRDRAPGLYLVLSVHTFADLCRLVEPHWYYLDGEESKRMLQTAINGVVALLPGLRPMVSVQWYAFVSRAFSFPAIIQHDAILTQLLFFLSHQGSKMDVVLEILHRLTPDRGLPLAPAHDFPHGSALISGIRKLALAFLERQLSVLRHVLSKNVQRCSGVGSSVVRQLLPSLG